MARPTPEKLALLRKMLSEKGIEERAPESEIPRRDGAEEGTDAPLSNGQSRLWFLDQFQPGSSLYNDSLALTIRFDGPEAELDTKLFRQAFEEIVRRHEILRTTFHMGSPDPVQRIAPVENARVGEVLPFREVDLRPEGENAQAKLAPLLLEDVQEPFELDRLPLHRATLARTADDTWVFGLAMHHMISDGVSYGVIYQELGAIYRALQAGRPSPLPELPIQFADFAAWEHAQLDENEIAAKLPFWKRYLGGDLPAIRWPARAAKPKHSGAYHRFRFPDSLHAALNAFCRENQVTSNWVLMASYFALLHTLGGQDDIRIGTPSSTRKHGALEKLVGFFVQTVILRIDLSGNPSFRELLERTRETALEVSRYEDVPFERIVQAVRPGRDESLVPLIQAWIAPMKDLMPVLELPGATSSYQIVDGKIARFDFAIILDETRTGVEAFVEYDTDLFEEATVVQLAERYMRILRQAVDHPDTSLKLIRETAAAESGADVAKTASTPTRRAGPRPMKRVPRRTARPDRTD